MVLDYVIFGTALIGSGVAATYDLKTTEVPNRVFYAMLIVGIPAVILKIFFGGSLDLFALSGLTGLGLFGLGYLMYRIGQWGGADMALLGLVGFLMPSVALDFPGITIFPFGVSFLFNLFIVGAVYMIIYAIAFAARNNLVVTRFSSGIKDSAKLFFAIVASVAVVLTGVMLYLNSIASFTFWEMLRGIAVPTILTACFIFIYRFAKAVENFGFKKRIPVSKLRVGDMLMDERKLVGATQKQINKIKNSRAKFVWIKEGVRFAPAFPLALLFTLYVGDAVLLIRLFV